MPTVLKATPLSVLGQRSLIDDAMTGGRVTVLEVTLAPREIVAPLHRHIREDEYNIVLAGRIGAMLGDEVVIGEPGDVIYKPRDQWHTYWNAGDEPARVLELISPSGFEQFFAQVAQPTEELIAIGARYGLEFDFDSAPALMQAHGVQFGGQPA